MESTQYSVHLETGALAPTVGQPSVGSFTQGAKTPDAVEFMFNDPFTLNDTPYGSFRGRVSSLDDTDGNLSLEAETLLYPLNRTYTILPIFGSLYTILATLREMAGLGDNDLIAASPEAGKVYTFPGFKGSMWTALCDFMAANSLEIVWNNPHVEGVDSRFVVQGIRSSGTLTAMDTSRTRTINTQQVSKQVQVNYYETSGGILTSPQVYPVASQDNQIISVEAGQTTVVQITLDAWLTSINQPVCLDLIDPNTDYSGTDGVYCVAANDGLGITADGWKKSGGNLFVHLTDDPSIVEVTVVGPRADLIAGPNGEEDTLSLSPFSIAATSGNLYDSLRLTGDGIPFSRKNLVLDTGSSDANMGEDIQTVYDSPACVSRGHAMTVGLRIVQEAAGPSYTINRSVYSPQVSQDPRTVVNAQNLVVAPDLVYSTGWVVTGGTDNGTVAGPYDYVLAQSVTTSGETNVQVASVDLAGVQDGEILYIAAQTRKADVTGYGDGVFYIDWGENGGVVTQPSTSVTGEWRTYHFLVPKPAGATLVKVGFIYDEYDSQTIWTAAPIVSVGGEIPYFDGSHAPNDEENTQVSWDGATHNSTSTWSTVYPSIVLSGDLDGSGGVGKRFLDHNTMFRIETSDISQDGMQLSARMDTTVQDFNDVWAGHSINDFNVAWSGRQLRDFAVAPLNIMPQ